MEVESNNTCPFVSYHLDNIFKVHPHCSMHFIPCRGRVVFHWMDTCILYSYIYWWTFGLFLPLTTVKNAAMNTEVQSMLCNSILISSLSLFICHFLKQIFIQKKTKIFTSCDFCQVLIFFVMISHFLALYCVCYLSEAISLK